MKVLIAGDFAPKARLAKQIEEKRYSEVFSDDIRKIIKSADFSFVNLESPIVEEGYKPIKKCGPNLCCTPRVAEAFVYAGFTGVTMANNHILDFGSEGLHNSQVCCKGLGLDVVGVGNNLSDAERVLYLEKEGKILAVINCCEHEFSVATDTQAGANPLNPIRQFYFIQDAKKNADYVLVIVHGGHEHFRLPSPRMVETYRFFIDAGADAVVNHHQHCYSGYETYKGKPIFYGIGNFCFDLDRPVSNRPWNYGYMVVIDYDSQVNIEIFPYCQYAEEPTVKLLDRKEFDKELADFNKVICDIDKLQKEVEAYYSKVSSWELSLFEPYRGRVLGKLHSMGLLPSLFKGSKLLLALNHVMCESHRDKLLYALTNKNKI